MFLEGRLCAVCPLLLALSPPPPPPPQDRHHWWMAIHHFHSFSLWPGSAGDCPAVSGHAVFYRRDVDLRWPSQKGIGLVIALTAVPIYFFLVHPKCKLKCVEKVSGMQSSLSYILLIHYTVKVAGNHLQRTIQSFLSSILLVYNP